MLSKQAREFLDVAFELTLSDGFMGGPTPAERADIEAVRDEIMAALEAQPAPGVAVPDDVAQTMWKALAYWRKASVDRIFLAEDYDIEVQRIDAASAWLDQQPRPQPQE